LLQNGSAGSGGGGEEFKLRPLTLRDFMTVDGDSLPPVGTNEPVPLAKGLAVKKERREEEVLEFDD
jgi:hypothetical protein